MAALLGLFSCRKPVTVTVLPTTEEMKRCANSSVAKGLVDIPHYWPAGTFYEEEDRDRFLQDWYGVQLCALGERSLGAPVGAVERILRWAWFRSFHPGIAITVMATREGAKLSWVQLRGAGGDQPGLLHLQGTRDLSARDLASIDRQLESVDFWALPTNDFSRGGLDGSQWIVEIVEADRRHMVDRWSGGELEPLGRHLLKLADLRGEKVY